MSVVAPERCHSFAYTNTVRTPPVRNDHHAQLPASPFSRMSCVNRLAEFVDVIAATIEMPISHQGMERPDWKNSDDVFDVLRLDRTGIASRMAKKTAMAIQSASANFMAALSFSQRTRFLRMAAISASDKPSVLCT